MYSPLIAHIRKFVPLKDEDAEILTASLRHRLVTKKEYLLKEGQICTANYFVLKGCCRMYFIQETGTEQIIQFGIENWWITDFQSLDNQRPSRFYIQAVEDTELAVLDQRTAGDLFDRVPLLDRYFRLVVQRAFAASQQNLRFIYSFSGEERYLHFSRTFPDFVGRIPQYMVASYLGLTPEFVSKVRGRRK